MVLHVRSLLAHSLHNNNGRRRGDDWVLIPLILGLTLAFNLAHAEDWVALRTPEIVRGDPRGMACDAAGNRYVWGGFNGSADFHPLPGAVDLHSSVDLMSDVFVTRIHADGSYGWTQSIGGSGAEGMAMLNVEGSLGGITALEGTVYVWFQTESTDLSIGDAGPWSYLDGNGIIVALDAETGTVQSGFGDGGVVQIACALPVFPRAVAAHDGVLYVTGQFSGADLGIGALGNRSAPPANATFIAAIDGTSGAPIPSFGVAGVQTLESADGTFSWSIAAGTPGIYVAGMASTDLGIGGVGSLDGSGQIFVAGMHRTSGAALAGFASDGVQRLGGNGTAMYPTLALTEEVLYVGGTFTGNDFGIGEAGPMTAVESDGFVAAMNCLTGALWPGFGEDGVVRITSSGWEEIRSMAVEQDLLVVAGSFRFTTDLGIGAPGSGQSLGSNSNVFVAVLSSSTGAAHHPFGGDGLMTLVGINDPRARAVAIRDGIISLLIQPLWKDILIEDWERISMGAQDITSGLLMQWHAVTGEPVRGQELTMAPIAPRILGSSPFIPVVTPDLTSGNPVSLHSSDPAVATVTGMTVTVQGIGSCDIVAMQAAGNGRPAVAVGRTLTVIVDSVATAPQVQTRPMHAMTVDDHGNRYLLSTFFGTRDEDSRSDHGAPISAHEWYWNLAVTCLHADGSHVWSQSITGVGDMYPGAITITGNMVYVLGNALAPDLTIGAPSATSLWTIGGIDTFVVALHATTGAPVSGFGRNGIQRIGGTPSLTGGVDLVATPSGVYVLGTHSSLDLGIGGVGTFASQGPQGEAFIAALHPQTGVALTGFGSDGLQRITAAQGVLVTSLTIGNGVLYITGSYSGTSLGIGALGTLSSDGVSLGFVAAIDGATGNAVSGFGSGGLLPLRSTEGMTMQAAAVQGDTLFLIGHGSGTVTLGEAGSEIDLPVGPGLLMAVHRASGQPRAGFGIGGMVGFGSDGFTMGKDVVALGGKVVFTGSFHGDDFGVGSPGTVSSPAGEIVAMIVVVDGTTGGPDSGFSGDGIEIIGPGEGIAVARSAQRVFAAGTLSGLAGIGGAGTWNATTGWSGYVVAVDPQGASTGSGTAWPGTEGVVLSDDSGCGAGGSAFGLLLMLVLSLRRRDSLEQKRIA